MRSGAAQTQTVRFNFEFPRSEYPYLKLLCAQQGVSLREFATKLLRQAIEDAEDVVLAKKAQERLASMQSQDLIDWQDAKKLAGWSPDEEL